MKGGKNQYRDKRLKLSNLLEMCLLLQLVSHILGHSLELIDKCLLKSGLDNAKTLEFPLVIIIVL